MKRLFTLLLVGIMVTGLTGCGSGANDPPPTDSSIQTNGEASSTPEGPTSTKPQTPETTEAQAVAYEVTYSNIEVYTDSISTVWAQTIFEVTNTGTKDLYLKSGSYDIEDASGALVASRTFVSVYPDVISPGEKAYYYEETMLENVKADAELTILPRPSVAEAKVENIKLPVTDDALSDEQYGGLKLIGRVTNSTEETQKMIHIAVVLYDAAGTPICHMFTILMEELAPGDKIGFECSSFSAPDTITAESVASYSVVAYPLQMQF